MKKSVKITIGVVIIALSVSGLLYLFVPNAAIPGSGLARTGATISSKRIDGSKLRNSASWVNLAYQELSLDTSFAKSVAGTGYSLLFFKITSTDEQIANGLGISSLDLYLKNGTPVVFWGYDDNIGNTTYGFLFKSDSIWWIQSDLLNSIDPNILIHRVISGL